MTILEIAEDVTTIFKRSSPHLAIDSTRRGYDVRTASPIRDRAAVLETAAALMGLVLVVASVGLVAGDQWFWGLGDTAVAPTLGAIAMTAGIAFIWTALCGLRQSVRFDLYRREIQIVAHNQVNGPRIMKAHSFHEVTGAFLVRPTVPGKAAKLFLRIGFQHEFFEVARGTETEMEYLRQRLGKDLPAHV